MEARLPERDWGAAQQKPPSLILLAALAACGPLAINFYVPALPVVAAEYNVSPSAVQWTLTLYFIGVSLGQIIYGPLSDAIGRRPIVLVGLGLYCVASFTCYFSSAFDVLLISRFAQAAGGCVGMVMSRAILQDSYSHARFASALATVVMVSAVAPMLAPGVGGYIIQWIGWRSVFLILGLGSAIVLLLCWRHLPETLSKRSEIALSSLWAAYPIALSHRQFVIAAVAAALLPSTYMAFMAAGPYLVVRSLGRSPSVYGMAAMVAPLGFILGNAVARRLALRLGERLPALAGAIIAAVGIGCLLAAVAAFPLSLQALFLPLVVIAFGHGVGLACAVGVAMSYLPELKGTAAAFVGFLQMCFAALASTAGSATVGHGAIAIALVMAALHCMVLMLFFAMRRGEGGGCDLRLGTVAPDS